MLKSIFIFRTWTPTDQGWPNNVDSSSTCLVDSALNKLAYSSSSGKKATIPLKKEKYSRHAGNSNQHCFQTRKNDKEAWWSVDLLEKVQIQAINITFAEDEDIPKRYIN